MGTTILDQFLDPVAECLPPDVARRIVSLEPNSELMEQLEELRDKANEGELSPADRAEYEEFVESMDFIAILKAKARMVLKRQDS